MEAPGATGSALAMVQHHLESFNSPWGSPTGAQANLINSGILHSYVFIKLFEIITDLYPRVRCNIENFCVLFTPLMPMAAS